MDAFQFDFDTDSTLSTDTNSDQSNLDWTAFQSIIPPTITSLTSINNTNLLLPYWFAQHDDAVAPDNQSNFISTSQDDGIYIEIDRIFNGLNRCEQEEEEEEEEEDLLEPVHVNIQTNCIPSSSPIHIHCSSMNNDRPSSTCLPPPLVPRLSSSSTRSQCYHKLPEHAVKLMQDWYNANLDDPYPRSPDKKRFITEGNITAQQCRSWFANRRQRLKHVKRNQSRTARSHPIKLPSVPPIDEIGKNHEPCYYCQQQQQATTLNVVINQQTIEQLIQNTLRKLLYPPVM